MTPAQPLRHPSAAATDRCRLRLRIEGSVQGVGFRPHVHRLVHEAALGGFVRNEGRGVLLELEGERGAVGALVERLTGSLPPLARIDRLSHEELAPHGQEAFTIVGGDRAGAARALVAADAATCAACLAELFDPGDRRYRYPFVNCTECGPRFTIMRGVPYDRPLTTMAGFEMCADCRRECEDPADRRFHAESIACPRCGPRLALAARGGELVADGEEALAEAVATLGRGGILAVKGLAGYHLVCRADLERSAAELRARKRREDEPFAILVRDLDAAAALVVLSGEDRELLASSARPIVLAPRRLPTPIAPSVAPGRRELGVMLPDSPLHHLLAADAGGPLVLTGGNVADEPIAYRDEDAIRRLSAIADRILLHDRPIETRTDDSVARTVRLGDRRRPLWIRRSRGAVPESLALPVAAQRPLLACGGRLESTFCVAKGERAWLGPHLGDLEDQPTRRAFLEGIDRFERLFGVEPELVAHDLHPDCASTAHALGLDGIETTGVQHHHAHLAATLAEHGERGPALGAIFDGSGWGVDRAVWGGELLLGDLASFERLGHLRPVRLPGGERALREPWRMACSWLVEALGEAPLPPTLAGRIDPERWRAVAQLAGAGGAAAPVTTSVGRLFDAIAALAGLRLEATHEEQAAIELEAAIDRTERVPYEIELVERDGGLELDPRLAIRRVLADVRQGVDAGRIAARFHRGLAEATVAACAALAARHGLATVVLSGGVYQNAWLLEAVAAALADRGLVPLVPSRVPPNDGGLAFGQAAVAAARDAGRAAS